MRVSELLPCTGWKSIPCAAKLSAHQVRVAAALVDTRRQFDQSRIRFAQGNELHGSDPRSMVIYTLLADELAAISFQLLPLEQVR